MNERFELGYQRRFRAEHALIGGDWGAENHRHHHEYLWEVKLSATHLDHHGYLVDLVSLEASVEKVLSLFADACLNDLLEFQGLNPSLERFARVLGAGLKEELKRTFGIAHLGLQSVLWENEQAWASWTEE